MEDPNTLSFQSFNCRNDDDPFTLESLEGIDPKRIINIDGDCFDLKPLFNWVYNQEKMTNPLNRNTFGPETLERIKNAALKYFPCRVFIMNGNEVAASFKTTTLSTWEGNFTLRTPLTPIVALLITRPVEIQLLLKIYPCLLKKNSVPQKKLNSCQEV